MSAKPVGPKTASRKPEAADAASYLAVRVFEDEGVLSLACAFCDADGQEAIGKGGQIAAFSAFLKRERWVDLHRGPPHRLACATCADRLRRKKEAEDFARWLRGKRSAEATKRYDRREAAADDREV